MSICENQVILFFSNQDKGLLFFNFSREDSTSHLRRTYQNDYFSLQFKYY